MKDLATRLMSNSNHWVILDTETTGLGPHAEAVQIGILSPSGEVLLDTLIKPVNPISIVAFKIHGITNKMVSTSPTFLELYPTIKALVSGKEVVVFNAPYDKRIIEQSYVFAHEAELDLAELDLHILDLAELDLHILGWTDIMQPYAFYWGDWNTYHQSYTWQKLTNACSQQGIKIDDAHSAIGDCRLTLALIQAVAEK